MKYIFVTTSVSSTFHAIKTFVLDLKMGLSEIVQGLGDNPYFGAGFGLFGVGAVAAISRKVDCFQDIILTFSPFSNAVSG